MTELSRMVTVFNIDNNNRTLYIYRPDIYYPSEYSNPSRLILMSNNNLRRQIDLVLPENFRVTIYEDWDTHENHILAKISEEQNNLSLMNVIIDKYLLYNIVKEKETFLLVGEKVFYLENQDLMLYRTDNIPEYSHLSEDEIDQISNDNVKDNIDLDNSL